MKMMLTVSVFCFAAVSASSFALIGPTELVKAFMFAAIIILLES